MLMNSRQNSFSTDKACGGVLFLAGPTAVGKSEVAFILAERLNGEIVSVDSMQVYRGLDIGTAKPSAAQRRQVPHHLLDIVELNESFDAAKFVRLACEAVTQIQARGKVPILCGGTGLYFKAFLDGLGEAPGPQTELRRELEATPLPDLLRELEQRDPATLARIDRHNPRRVIRAIEVIRLSGKPYSSQRAAWDSGRRQTATAGASCFFAISRENAELRERIEARVERMFSLGLVAEVEQLLPRGLAENRTALQAIGYRQVVDYLRGDRSLSETKALVKQRTGQYAKRQRTWLRRHLPAIWIPCGAHDTMADVAERIQALWSAAA
jgi:tRNA dimethylallyltransferase